ncbi:MAG TPA: response regulator [Polyangiaceae bacterium]|jgi:CheY-like chemotaxis protein|nr:response regulator [Polyangiaceae bacterium]
MPKVLLVDDSPVVRRVLTTRLAAAGFDVVAEPTADATRAVDLSSVACAVVDIELPDASGADLAGELLRRRSSLPVAFFTAGASEAVMARARAHGPVFAKPDVEPLMAWIASSAQPPPTK